MSTRIRLEFGQEELCYHIGPGAAPPGTWGLEEVWQGGADSDRGFRLQPAGNVLPWAPGLCQELSWSHALHSLVPEPWFYEGDFRMTSTHNTAFLGKWKSRIPSNSDSPQHPIIDSGPRKEAANLFIWAAKWTGLILSYWILVWGKPFVTADFTLRFFGTAQAIPSTSFKSPAPVSYKLLNPRSYW